MVGRVRRPLDLFNASRYPRVVTVFFGTMSADGSSVVWNPERTHVRLLYSELDGIPMIIAASPGNVRDYLTSERIFDHAEGSVFISKLLNRDSLVTLMSLDLECASTNSWYKATNKTRAIKDRALSASLQLGRCIHRHTKIYAQIKRLTEKKDALVSDACYSLHDIKDSISELGTDFSLDDSDDVGVLMEMSKILDKSDQTSNKNDKLYIPQVRVSFD